MMLFVSLHRIACFSETAWYLYQSPFLASNLCTGMADKVLPNMSKEASGMLPDALEGLRVISRKNRV